MEHRRLYLDVSQIPSFFGIMNISGVLQSIAAFSSCGAPTVSFAAHSLNMNRKRLQREIRGKMPGVETTRARTPYIVD